MSSVRVAPFLFGFSPPVSPRTYAMAGFSLAALKYVVDALVIFVGTGKFFSPLLYLHPLLSARMPGASPSPGAYWRIWAEWLVHAIHGRVLEQVKRLAEQPIATR